MAPAILKKVLGINAFRLVRAALQPGVGLLPFSNYRLHLSVVV